MGVSSTINTRHIAPHRAFCVMLYSLGWYKGSLGAPTFEHSDHIAPHRPWCLKFARCGSCFGPLGASHRKYRVTRSHCTLCSVLSVRQSNTLPEGGGGGRDGTLGPLWHLNRITMQIIFRMVKYDTPWFVVRNRKHKGVPKRPVCISKSRRFLIRKWLAKGTPLEGVQQCDSMGEILPHMVCGVKMGPNYAVPLVEYSTTNGAHRLGMDAHQCTAPRREQPLFWKCAPYWLKRSSVGRSLLSTPAQNAIRARCATHLADAGDI